MMYIRGEAREQGRWTNFCRVIEAFVGRLDMAQLGFVREEPTETRLRWRCKLPQSSANNNQKQISDVRRFRTSLSPTCCRPVFVTGLCGRRPLHEDDENLFLGSDGVLG